VLPEAVNPVVIVIVIQQDVNIDTLKGNLDLWRSSHCDLIPTKHTSVSLRSLATTTQRRICYWDSNNIQSRVMS